MHSVKKTKAKAQTQSQKINWPPQEAGKKVVLNIFPSVDTPTCATSVRTFNERAASLAQRAEAFSRRCEPGSVRWLDAGAQLRLVESPLDIAQAVRSKLLRQDDAALAAGPARSWIFTSATLGDDARLRLEASLITIEFTAAAATEIVVAAGDEPGAARTSRPRRPRSRPRRRDARRAAVRSHAVPAAPLWPRSCARAAAPPLASLTCRSGSIQRHPPSSSIRS